jgi:hypothetical protein
VLNATRGPPNKLPRPVGHQSLALILLNQGSKEIIFNEKSNRCSPLSRALRSIVAANWTAREILRPTLFEKELPASAQATLVQNQPAMPNVYSKKSSDLC